VNFKQELIHKTEEIEQIIDKYLPAEEGEFIHLAQAMNYSMKAGGKRIRPLLMQESYLLFQGKEEVIQPFMAAMEMIHTHSLIHDDLPALDNDDYRRGRPTTHKIYGEAAAILAGDALLNYAYETIAKGFSMTENISAAAAAYGVLSRKTGIFGMLGGQSVDVENDGKDIERDTLEFIYANKTSALIEAPLMVGAILAGANRKQIQSMEQIGHRIGLAFQIQDDILDVTSTQEELGKPVFSDEKNHKVTYVTLEGIEHARKKVAELTGQAQKELQRMPGDKTFLSELFTFLIDRKK
jgi:geranylgeranyl diphosphate synthase type II